MPEAGREAREEARPRAHVQQLRRLIGQQRTNRLDPARELVLVCGNVAVVGLVPGATVLQKLEMCAWGSSVTTLPASPPHRSATLFVGGPQRGLVALRLLVRHPLSPHPVPVR